jgi:hypothetical protein
MMFLAIVRHSTTRPSSRNSLGLAKTVHLFNEPRRPPLRFMRSADLENETVYLAESK